RDAGVAQLTGLEDAVAADRAAVAVVVLVAARGAAAVAADAHRDRGRRAHGLAGAAVLQRVGRAGVAVVAHRRAGARLAGHDAGVAGLARRDDAVAADDRAVGIVAGVAARRAAAVAALAGGDRGRGALGLARGAREGVGRAGVAVVAAGRAG